MDAIALHQYGFDCAVASLGTSLTEEHATLLSRYTEQVYLIYDADEAGQRAAQRAIPMLERAGLRIKVLKIRDAKDPDEFLKKFGPDKFKLLLEESANRVEYQLNVIRGKYDIREDDQKIRYVHEAAELICTLDSPIQREVYGGRVAETAGISMDAMKLEVNKAFKRRMAILRKKKEREDLAPAKALQPKERSIRYDNMKSAIAEEGILSQILREPALFEECKHLRGSDFSVPLLGKAYDDLRSRYSQGLEVNLSVLELTPEEMSHVAGITHRSQGTVNADAFKDCVATVLSQHQSAGVSTDDDLMALREKLKERKGTRA
jgi:DNA primase